MNSASAPPTLGATQKNISHGGKARAQAGEGADEEGKGPVCFLPISLPGSSFPFAGYQLDSC